MNQANSRYLLYKDYESGLNNELMSIELAVGIAYLTNRKLIYYGTVGEGKQLIHIRGGNAHYVPAMRQDIINNQRIPTILDLLEELPVETIDYKRFHENIESQKITYHNSDLRLINTFFVPSRIESDPNKLDEFAEGRQIFKDVEEDVLHFKECNLGFYSRFFYTPPDSFYSVIDQIRFKEVYRELANKISQSLGEFNGIALRLTDFRKFLPQNEETYREEILTTLRANFSNNELLVILSDESENKDFFIPLTTEYKNHLFLDEFIIREFADYFKTLPFTDEVTLGLICNMVMHNAKDFIGTPGSSFSAIIHRNWLKKQIQKGKSVPESPFKYINKGFAGSFKDGIFLETKEGFYSWNRVDLPIHTETKSWYREWVESVVPPPVVTTKQGKFSINLPVKILPIWKKSKRIQRKTTNLNRTKVKVFDDNQPEIELLLCCARTQPSSEISRQIQNLVQQNIDWDFLLQIAARHNVLPLLYQNLKTLCPEAVPKPVLSELRNFFHTNAAHNLFLTQELLKILKLFQDNDIPAIPFKGPVLAVSVYGNLAMRQFGDLDIWVDSKDFLKAIDFLQTQGYRRFSSQEWIRKLALYKLYLEYNINECPLNRFDNQVSLDIHKSITSQSFFLFQLDFEHVWKRHEPISLFDTEVPNLYPEDLLLILCVHGSKHGWEKLGWICDVAEFVLVHQEMEWTLLIEQTKKLGCERMLLMGLTLANNLLGTPLPEPINQSIKADPKIKPLAMQVCQGLFHDSFIFDASSKFSYYFRMMERPQDKLRYSVGFILNKSLIRVLWFIRDLLTSSPP